MDFSRVGEKLLSSVRSARSLGLLSSQPDRPEVPARAAAAAAVARALAGIPPHQRVNLPSSSEELTSIYGSRPDGQGSIEDLEEIFYEEDFDPVKYVLENTPLEGSDLAYFEERAALRLAQLDRIAETLSHHVMEHHEEMVKGMQLVMELEQDLKVANVICMNGRRHLTSSMHEVSQDLVVNSNAKKKQVLLDMLPILTELRHAVDMQMELEILVEEGNYVRAFQVLPEYLQVLDSFPELSAMQEMSHGVEAWLARTLQKLDSLLLGVCQSFMHDNYLTAVDAYAIVGDTGGLAEKIQSFFMQEILSETHLVLKEIVLEEIAENAQRNRLTYSDLCAMIPESNFRRCLLRTLDILFKLMCSYYAIMNFLPEEHCAECLAFDINPDQKNTPESSECDFNLLQCSLSQKSMEGMFSGSLLPTKSSQFTDDSAAMSGSVVKEVGSASLNTNKSVHYANDNSDAAHHSPFYQLRKDATTFVARMLDRGRKNIWQLTASRVSVLLTCPAVCSTSTHQFLRNYEDLNVFILAGEAFSGVEATEFRQRLKMVCVSYVASFHRQNIHALKLVLEKETWVKISSDAMQVINLAGLVGDGAPLIAPSLSSADISIIHSKKLNDPLGAGGQKNGFANWLKIENPFSSKTSSSPRQSSSAINMQNGLPESGVAEGHVHDLLNNGSVSMKGNLSNQSNRSSSALEDENEDLLADFIDEDSQLPSRIPKPMPLGNTAHWNDEEINSQTGSSLCLLRLMDKYARLMQKLQIINYEFFKGICQLFGIFFYFIFEVFCQNNANLSANVSSDSLNDRLKGALSRVSQDCDQWKRQQSLPCSPKSSTILGASISQMDVTPMVPASSIFGHAPNTTFGLKERCIGAETISLVARVLHRSRPHLQSKLLKNNAALVEDFFENTVSAVPDLIEDIHMRTARLLLNINGYVDKIANVKWEVKELGLEHNAYIDLLLGEFKHYKTRLAHGGIHKEVQDLLLMYGVENVSEILLEGLSRVKRCTDEGRALMSLDLQVLINGLKHFVPTDVTPKLQIVETFIKEDSHPYDLEFMREAAEYTHQAYYLPETEYVYWARTHQEYSKAQIVALINLVATMKSWKRKTRLEVLEKVEAGT